MSALRRLRTYLNEGKGKGSDVKKAAGQKATQADKEARALWKKNKDNAAVQKAAEAAVYWAIEQVDDIEDVAEFSLQPSSGDYEYLDDLVGGADRASVSDDEMSAYRTIFNAAYKRVLRSEQSAA